MVENSQNKIEIIPEETYTIVFNGERYPGCKIDSVWNGLTKFILPSEESVVVDGFEDSAFGKIIANIVGVDSEVRIVKISRSLMFDNTDGEPEKNDSKNRIDG